MQKLLSLNFQERIFDITIYISYALIILSSLGLSQFAPKFLDDMDYYVRIYICLFLLWRFNPFIPLDKFTNLDRKIAFSAGLFILTTTVLNDYLVKFKNSISNYFDINPN
jgi:hypothetical protein